MKKFFFFIAAVAVAMTANAAVVNVEPGMNTLVEATSAAQAGDELVLTTGVYEIDPNYTCYAQVEGLVIKAAEGASPVVEIPGAWSCIKVSATATFDGIVFDGKGTANYLIAVVGENSGTLTIKNCEFKNWVTWAVSNQYETAAHADAVVVDNCLFHDGLGSAISFSDEAPEGKHSCNSFKMTNSTIYNVVSTVYRAIIQVNSNGEATGAQNEIVIDHVTLANYDSGDLGAISMRKSSNLKISNSIVCASAAGEKGFYIYGGNVDNVVYYNCDTKSGPTYTNCVEADPKFVDAANGNFELAEGSPALGAATDGSNLGDPRWNKPAAATRTVTIVVLPEGAATVTGAGEYEDGASVTVTASESDDYVFMGWMDYATEEIVAYDYEYTFQVLEDVVLIAYYIPLLEGESKDLVIGENTLTASAELSIGKLNMNLVLGEEEEGLYWLAETSTLSIDGNEAILVDGVAMVVPEAQAAVAEMIVMYNEALYYIGVVMVAPETSVDNITTTVAPTKIFKNGQILVVREGVAYDLVGRIVK